MKYPSPPMKTMYITVCMDINKTKRQRQLLEKRGSSLKNLINSIDFIGNDDPDNYRNYVVKFDEDIRMLSCMKEHGHINDDYIEDHDVYIACHVYDYIASIDDKMIVEKIFGDTESKDYLNIIKEQLISIHGELIREIDKLTI